MKREFFLLLFITAIFLFSCDSQHEEISTNLITLTPDPITLTATLDSSYFRDTTQYIFIKATLSNKTLDTFRYITMNCSWAESFTTNSKDLSIYITPCYQNWFFTYNIPPFKSEDYLLTITATRSFKSTWFKIGFNLIADHKVTNIDSLFSSLKDMKHVIWSNSIILK